MQISATEEPSRPEFFLWDFVEAVVICYVEGNVCVFLPLWQCAEFYKVSVESFRKGKQETLSRFT